MYFSSALLAILTSAACASASISVTFPIASSTITAGKNTSITWLADSGVAASTGPLAASFGSTKVGLYTGSSTQQTLLQDLGTVADPLKTKALVVDINPTAGPSGGLYFIRFQSINATDTSGAPLEAFSARFNLTKMTGKFTDAENAENSGISSGALVVSTLASSSSATSAAASTAGTKAIQTASQASASASASAVASSAGRVGAGILGLAGGLLGAAWLL